MPDRHGNPYFTDHQQVQFLTEFLHNERFEGTHEQLAERAEAWWWGESKQVPALEEARRFNAERARDLMNEGRV